MSSEIRFGYASVTKHDGVFGFATSGENNLRTGIPVKADANGRYVAVSGANDVIAGFSYWGYQTITPNGLVKESKYDVLDNSVVVRTTNYSFDSFREGDQFLLIKEGYMDVVVSADVAVGDDVYYNPTTKLYTNVSTNNIKVGNTKFTAPAKNGDKVLVYFK